MQFTYTKNSSRSEVFGLGSSPLRRSKSRKSIQKAVEATPRTRRNQGSQAVNFASFGPENNDPPLTIENESEAFLSTQRTQRNATEALTEVKDMIESKEEGNLYSLEDGRETQLEFQKLLVIEFGITVVAVIGACLTVLSYDLEFSGEDYDFGQVLLWSIFASNKICIVLTVFRYLQSLRFQKARNLILQKATLASTGEIWYVIAEIIVFLIQPYPFLQGIKVEEYDDFTGILYYYHVNDFLCLLLVLRLYVLGRFLLNSMMYRSPRSHRIGDMYGAESGYIYAIRSIMKIHAEKVVPLLLCSSIMIFGYMIRVCERPLNRNPTVDIEFNTYWNSMWCVILTMTTVGYGDVYARTMLGRTVSFFICIWGTFVVSIMVVTLTGILSMSNAEEKSLMVLRRLEARKRQKQEAAHILTNIAKMSLIRKKPVSKKEKDSVTKESVSSLKRHLRTFRRTTREIKGLDDSMGAVEEVTRQIRFVGEDIKTLMESQKELQKKICELVSASSPQMKYPGSLYVVPESTMSFKGGIDEDVVIHKAR